VSTGIWQLTEFTLLWNEGAQCKEKSAHANMLVYQVMEIQADWKSLKSQIRTSSTNQNYLPFWASISDAEIEFPHQILRGPCHLTPFTRWHVIIFIKMTQCMLILINLHIRYSNSYFGTSPNLPINLTLELKIVNINRSWLICECFNCYLKIISGWLKIRAPLCIWILFIKIWICKKKGFAIMHVFYVGAHANVSCIGIV